MTQMEMQLMQEDCHVLQARLSRFLSDRFVGPCRDQNLARIVQSSPRTARNYFNDVWPGARAWRGIVREFGRDVIAAVFDPDIDPVLATLRAEETRLNAALQSIRARRVQAEGFGGGVPSSGITGETGDI